MKLLALSFLFLLASTSPADLVTQTDWSGGGGEPGPVTDWGNLFDTSTSMDWFSTPGSLLLGGALIGPVTNWIDASQLTNSISVSDIDGDGDMDAFTTYGNAYWWRNEDGTGTDWSRVTVTESMSGIGFGSTADIDGNGTCDVVVSRAYPGPYNLYWFENSNGIGTGWVLHTIAADAYPRVPSPADIDGDGDMDVAFCTTHTDSIYWAENLSGYGTSWLLHRSPTTSQYTYMVETADLDGDGDIDLMSANTNDALVWHENVDGAGDNLVLHVIDGTPSYGFSLDHFDIDDDGDQDIALTSIGGVSWFENVDGTADTWSNHPVWTGSSSNSIAALDADGDGDGDLLSSGTQLMLFLNTDGTGTTWFPVYWSAPAQTYISVPGDLNGDGFEDAVNGGPSGPGGLYWCQMFAPAVTGNLTSSILDSGSDPLWGTVDWVESCPAGTDITVDIRVGYDPGSMGSWYTCSAPGTAIPSYMDHHPYLQYKANLDRGSAESSPLLEDITVSWNPAGTAEEPGTPPGWSLSPVENPARGGALTVCLGTAEAGPVILTVYDLSGRMLAETELQAAEGLQNVSFPGLPAGLVVCTAAADGYSGCLRVVVLD